MADYIITFVVNGATDESDALAICSERLASNRNFEVEKVSD